MDCHPGVVSINCIRSLKANEHICSGSNQDIAHQHLSEDLKQLAKWIEQSKMKLNADKSSVMWLPQSLVNAPPPDVKINDICLTPVKVQKYLGVINCGGWIMSQLFVKRFLFYLLNQARAGRRPARAWFLEITLMRTSVCVCVCVCVVCVSAPQAIRN